MIKLVLTSLTALVLAMPASAECPAVPDHTEAMSKLLDSVQMAKTEHEGRQFSGKMWDIWFDAPDEAAKAVLESGLRKQSSYNFLGAIKDFDALVAYCPDYAEGYNQRAFSWYLQQEFEKAEVDLLRAIELSPTHIAARAGLALTYLELGRLDEARSHLLAALELNPWLSERHLLAKGGRLEPEGEDI